VYALALNDEKLAEATPDLDVTQMPIIMAASSALAGIGSEPQYTPRRPSLLPQLLETVGDEDASLRAMSRILAQDPELTSNLLRTANSALYRASGAPIESIERAAAQIGTQGIRSLIAAALVQPLATGASSGLGKFGAIAWEHSQYSATASESFAARAQSCDPFGAHLLGLLHGLGSVAVFRVLTDQYAQAQMPLAAAAVAQALDTNSSVTAKRVAANWGLSARIQEALESQSAAAPVGQSNALGEALRFGLLAGAVTLLCKNGNLSVEAGRGELALAGYTGANIDRIWDRLVKAYVRP
jgi:HD-like signal output (HDOD) protein